MHLVGGLMARCPMCGGRVKRNVFRSTWLRRHRFTVWTCKSCKWISRWSEQPTIRVKTRRLL